MKRILFINIMCIMAAFVSAQSIKPQTATFEDYIPLLNQAGYQVYSFDISEFLNDTYQVTFKIKEYKYYQLMVRLNMQELVIPVLIV